MNTFEKLLIVGVLGMTFAGLPACSTWDKLNDTERGAVIGGGTGAAVGGGVAGGTGALIGGAGGALAGGVIGHEVQKDDDRDHRRRRNY